MTTTDFSAPPPPPRLPPTHVMRRSSTDRIAAGVCGGLSDYFRVDPVLFRVLFATTAFFGGAGIIAYLLAWAVIPDATTEDAPVDRVVRELRRRHVPFWLVAGIGIVVAWALLFSWWAPWPFAPVIIAVVILVAALSRRTPPAGATGSNPPPAWTAPSSPTDFSNASPEMPLTATEPVAGPTRWMPETQAWFIESRARARLRRRRAAPVRWATLAVLVVTIAVLALADTISGIVIPAYFWTGGAIVLAGLIVGVAMRRTPWSLTLLLIPAIVGLIGFGGTRASLHDGSGQKQWTPTASTPLASSYRLAFGQGVLDLSGVSVTSPQHTSITMAAGQVRILVPKDLNVVVNANVHIGTVEVDGQTDFLRSGSDADGVGLDLTVPSTTGATGPQVTIDVHLADGQLSVQHV